MEDIRSKLKSEELQSKLKSKTFRRWAIIGTIAVALIAVFFGYRHSKAKKTAVPPGIAWGNGRLEAQLVDAAAKEPLRIKQILVREGDIVKPGQVVVQMDTLTMEAELAEAKAGVASAQQQLAVAEASIAEQKSKISLAKIELARSQNLVREHAGSQRDVDVRRMAMETAVAGLAGAGAKLRAARDEVKVAEAKVATTQSRINDATLRSPVLGRVLYRVAEPGEVLSAGGKALTMVNLEDVYMEIFLPAKEAAAIKLGAEARITLDYMPGLAGPAYVSFVSPEAQFTPKEVETRSEREKLMFRVKLQVPKEVVENNIELIKTGARGMGYVKLREDARWPDWLQHLIPVAGPGVSTAAGTP